MNNGQNNNLGGVQKFVRPQNFLFSSRLNYLDVQTKFQTPTTIPSCKFGRIASNPSLDNPNGRTDGRTDEQSQV